MKINQLFRIIQGHQITDEEIYKNRGDIVVLTGKNEIKGFWNKQIVKESDLPCITYPTKANSGEAFVQKEIFDANNTAILIPLEEWKDKIDFFWFAYKLSKIFPDIQTSKEGVSYLNKEIVEDFEFNIPKKEEQTEEYKNISRIINTKSKMKGIINKINKIKESELVLTYKKYQIKNYPANKIFDFVGGNSGLTEHYVYQNLLSKEERKYILLSGSIEINKKEKLPLCAKPKNKSEKINIFSGEGIHVVRKGIAGKINYLENGDYTLNDDAYILKLKKNLPFKISLKWFSKVYAKIFLDFASQSDNSTWNKDEFNENAKFDIPDLKEQKNMLEKFETLDKYEMLCNDITDKINHILNKEITYER